LAERDVEMERMTTTLFALNEKLVVLNDVKTDCEEHKGYFIISEAKRVDLQSHIESAAEAYKEDTKRHTDMHAEQAREITRLRTEV